MILAGETCAPWTHLTARGALGSLDEADTRRIAGGTERLVDALRSAIPDAKVITGATVTSVGIEDGLVSVSWHQGHQQYQAPFRAAILTVPDSRSLLRERGLRPEPKVHFHAYVSVLLEYSKRWWARSLRQLRYGLYTDSALNFIEEVPTRTRGRYVLRILQPNAECWLRWSDRRIRSLCIRELRRLSKPGTFARAAKSPTFCSIKRWRQGLPCGSSGTLYHQVHRRIYLAGDRFAKWPSMDGALESGRAAATELTRVLKPPRR